MDADSFDDTPERLIPPRSRDALFYLVLFLLVLPLSSIVPLSWVFVVHSLYSGSIWSFSGKTRSCFAIALAEVFFSIYYYNMIRSVSGPSPNGSRNIPELQSTFRRVLQAGLAKLPEDGFDEESLDIDRPGSPAESIERLDYNDPRAIDFRNYLRTWFGKVPWSSIRKEEMSRWLYWSIFNSAMPAADVMPQSHREAIEDGLENIERRAGCKIPDGSNPSVRPSLLTLDPVNTSFRPLVWYIGVFIANFIARRYLQTKFKVQFAAHQGFEYFVFIPNNWKPENQKIRPVIFVHGLGLGLLQYLMFLTRLIRCLPEYPILIPIQAHISQDIFHPRFVSPMSRCETVKCLVGVLRSLGWVTKENDNNVPNEHAGVTMLSHSNGSFTHAWFLKEHPEMITRSCFIDPVTFCSWEGDVCYNFIYRPCKTAFELLVYYFVGSELGVANFLQRHFDWPANSLWYEEIPNARDPSKSMFVLGGKDSIVNSERVVRYLRSHGVRKGLVFAPNHRHGQALLAGTEVYGQIMNWLRG